MSLDLYLTYDNDGNNTEVFWANITHNLNTMADEAGIYKTLWRPEVLGFEKASQLIPSLEEGIRKLENDPARYRQFNPSNNWGSYDGLLSFSKEVLEACRKYPHAKVNVSR